LFHSGTSKNENNQWITNGGRVLINVAIDNNIKAAAVKATEACKAINFDGKQFRNDIALKALTM
jgi:phosphoribosylamine-glycine ligase